MPLPKRRTKIVATIGPASRSPEVIEKMVRAGMNVARLNFSHGSYSDHAQVVTRLRSVSESLDTPITLLQDLQGPKIRVGHIPEGALELSTGDTLTFVPMAEFTGQPKTVAIDYPYLAEEAEPELQILLDDGLLELRVEVVEDQTVRCRVIQGGILKSRKGVNLPALNLRLPAMTDKDKADLEFGLSQGVDIVSLSFVRQAEDILSLKALLREKGAADLPVLAKIEKPQAIENLEAIVDAADAIMVARGDLGVEMSPEKVPRLQKRIIRLCNQKSKPVITATQMLDSMIRNPRPTRAETSDVANAIIDGTDAVMLSGESAVGEFPVQSVVVLARIAEDIEPEIQFFNHPPDQPDEVHALSEALNTIDKILDLKCVAAFTTTGHTAMIAAAERPKAQVIAFTPDLRVYHRLNLIWGVKPLFLKHPAASFEQVVIQMEKCLLERGIAESGDKILILAGSPVQRAHGANLIKLHTVS